MISPSEAKIAIEVLNWAQNFLSKPHENLGRPGDVCPFVKASIENDSFFIDFCRDVTEKGVARIIDEMRGLIGSFPKLHPYEEKDRLRKTLLLVFPAIPKEQARVLDVVHGTIKDEFVENGLMVAQFHPHCAEAGVHNSGFRGQVCEYPLMAIRHMAKHDILFLGQKKEWFREYNLRFGSTWRAVKNLDELSEHDRPLYERFENAKRRFQVQ